MVGHIITFLVVLPDAWRGGGGFVAVGVRRFPRRWWLRSC